jgi:hypothetical protein
MTEEQIKIDALFTAAAEAFRQASVSSGHLRDAVRSGDAEAQVHQARSLQLAVDLSFHALAEAQRLMSTQNRAERALLGLANAAPEGMVQ